jgi:NADH-quinone oxidoreductase subunit E
MVMHACVASPLDEKTVDEIIARYPDKTGDLLSILEDLQKAHPASFLPCATLEAVAVKTGLARSQVFSVVTFYSFFNTAPQGRHSITVCRGTACHTRGSKALLDNLMTALNIPAGKRDEASFTSEDLSLTVRTVACFGQCAMAPVVATDHDIHGQVTDTKMRALLKVVRPEGVPHENT